MKRNMYSVEILEDCRYFVVAYSKEHAIVEACSFMSNVEVKEIPLSNCNTISKEEAEDIIIDHIYPNNNYTDKSIDFLYLFENIDDIVENNGKEYYGVVGDDFIAY